MNGWNDELNIAGFPSPTATTLIQQPCRIGAVAVGYTCLLLVGSNELGLAQVEYQSITSFLPLLVAPLSAYAV